MKPIKCEETPYKVCANSSGESSLQRNGDEKKVEKSVPLVSASANAPMKIFGINIYGIDPHLIRDASLNIEVPLREGNKEFIGVKKDAKLVIKKDTTAKISLLMARNIRRTLSVKFFSLSFSHAIAIKNPASSLQNDSDFACALKDRLADVKLRNIAMGDDGSVFVDGKIKTLKFFKRPIPENIFNVDVMNLENSFLEALGFIELAENNQNSLEHLGERFNVRKVFNQLGAITKTARYSLQVVSDSAPISLEKNGARLLGPGRPIKINLGGELSFFGQEIFIKVHGKESSVVSSLGFFIPNADVAIKKIKQDNSTEIDLHAEIHGAADKLQIDSFAEDTEKFERARSTISSNERNVDKFSFLLGAKSAEIHTNIDVKAKSKNAVTKANGSYSVDINLHEPYGRHEKSSVAMDGFLSAHLNMDEFSCVGGKTEYLGKGVVDLSIHPSERTLAKFPELKTVNYHYGFEYKPNNRARLSPPEYGLTRFLRPVKNFEGHNERVDHDLTKGPLYIIGTPEYFLHVEKITGAKLRSARSVKLLIDGVNSMPERLKIINEAKEYICFQTLVFKDDESGWLYAKALVDACRRGVKVFGIVDSLGNIESLKELSLPHPIYNYLRAHGVNLQIYNGFLEEAMRAIFSVIKKYPSVFTIKSPEHFSNVADMIKFFRELIEEIDDKNPKLLPKDKENICVALHTMLNGKNDVSPIILANELKDALKHTTTLDDVLALIKRMGKLSFRAHEKYLVADHKVAIVGGLNVATEYLRGGNGDVITLHGKQQLTWRDSDVFLAGDIAVEVFRSFRRNFCELSNVEIPLAPTLLKKQGMGEKDDYAVSLMQHRPMEDGDHKILNFLLYNLRTLKRGEKAWFETAYFLPRGILRILQKEMVMAARRGVDVRIITNSEKTSDFPLLVEASMFDVRELLEAGARVFFRTKNRMVHAKVMVLGDRLTVMGSWNMDNRSASHDTEDMAAIYDVQTTVDMIGVLRKDMCEQSREVSLKEITNRSLWQEIRSAGMLLFAELV